MAAICFYFELHQPLRVNPTATNLTDLFADTEHEKLDNRRVLEKVVNKCYLPTSTLILDLLNRYPNFKVSMSITGTLLDQLAKDFPEVIELFKKLGDTGRVEFLNETYYHSLSSLYAPEEFSEQIALHKAKIKELFGQDTVTFRNTEIVYSDNIAEVVKAQGFSTILAEGADRILGWKSPNFLYKSTAGINLLLKNYKLSDDIGFKFSDHKWFDFPQTPEKYLNRVLAINKIGGDIINLFMDYETFGEHQWEVTGIFQFFEALIVKLNENNISFVNPKDIEAQFKAQETISMKDNVSWADEGRDTSAWNSNKMQQDSLKEIFELTEEVKKKNDPELLNITRYLQTSDHFYYMSTKDFDGKLADQAVHNYFSPYGTPLDAYNAYQNALKILRAAL